MHFLLTACGIAVLASVTFLTAHAAWDMYGRLQEANVAEEGAQAQLAALQSQQQSVTQQVGELASAEGVEAQVRERFGVAKPGEGEIDIVEQTSADAAPAAPAKSFWQGLWQTLTSW